MKTKATLLVGAMIATVALVSCNKNKCADCHYDANGGEVEIGNYCGDDLTAIEANGYTDSTGTYTVHCGEDHE